MSSGRALFLCLCASVQTARAVAQCPDGSPPPCSARASVATAAGANSVGVMLFNNQTRDSAFNYLSDGLATEIATSLARVPRLEVRSPGAVRSAQRNTEPDPRTIGRRLNVRYVVEGDFQRGGDRIRISVRLVAVPSGTQRWSEAFTRPAADLLAVQEEIANAVATAIAGQLLPQERTVLASRPTRSAEAYDHLLRGNFQMARRNPAGVGRAIEEYLTAVRLDPSFVQAQARVGVAYALFLDWGWDMPGVPRDSQLAIGMRAADRALALDSSSGDAWLARGYLLAFRNPATLEGVLAALERATSLEPGNAEAWHQLSSWQSALGHYDESITTERRAIALEPTRAIGYLNLGGVFEILRRDAEAEQAYDSALAIDPEFYSTYANRGFVRLRRGNIGGARADAAASLRYSPPNEEHYGLSVQAAVAATSGDTVQARQLLARAQAPFSARPPGVFAAQAIALGLVIAGEPQQALDVLERAQPRGGVLWFEMQFPAFDPIRSDPRFQRLMAAARPAGAR